MALLSAAGPLRGAEPSGWLLVANKNDQALGIVDPVTNRQVASIPVGGVTGHEVIASPDGTRAYVPIYGNAGVGRPGSDGQTMAVIDLGHAAPSWRPSTSGTAFARTTRCSAPRTGCCT